MYIRSDFFTYSSHVGNTSTLESITNMIKPGGIIAFFTRRDDNLVKLLREKGLVELNNSGPLK